jgi:pyruvate/2-oxoglutarate dehydrogenase complex dihydrolipoamide acyltransferase (E2) component
MTDVTLGSQAWKDIDPATEALLDKWLVAPGDTVRAGQPVANAVLVKSNLEVTAPTAGRIAQILVPAGQTFARGKPIAVLKETL